MTCALFYTPGLLLGLAMLAPSQASAGVIIVGWGETIRPVGELPRDGHKYPPHSQVGYKYHFVSLFWLNIVTTDGTFCVYQGDRYRAIGDAEAARLLGKPETELDTPFWYRWPSGWLVFGPLLIIGFISSVLDEGNGEKKSRKSLMEDPRYQAALGILNERYMQPVGGGEASSPQQEPPDPTQDKERFRVAFEAAVEYLVAAGVTRQAARNLAVAISELAATVEKSSSGNSPAETK